MVLAAGIAAGASLAGSFMSNASSARQQKRSFGYAKALQQQQYDLGIRGYKEAPSAQRQGLTSAGYNPMLALGNVGNGVSVAGGTPVSANATDTSGIKESIQQAIQLKNQTDQTKAQTDQMYAEADKAKVEKATLVDRLPFVSKQAKADYMKTSMESAKLENDIHYQDEYLNYLDKSLELQERLGKMGFANSLDVANINAAALRYGSDNASSASRYSADRAYNASTYASNVAAESTPFRYATKNAGKIIRNLYDFYDKSNRFIYGRR